MIGWTRASGARRGSSWTAAVADDQSLPQIYSLLRKKPRPALEVNHLRLIQSHGFVHTHFSPQQEFNLIFCERPECARVRLEPDVLLRVRSAHPVREPVVEFACRLLCTSWISVGAQDGIFLGVRDITRAVVVRHSSKRWVHFTRRKSGIRHGARPTGLVDFNLRTVLRRGHTN
jgi:hypothetical protein